MLILLCLLLLVQSLDLLAPTVCAALLHLSCLGPGFGIATSPSRQHSTVWIFLLSSEGAVTALGPRLRSIVDGALLGFRLHSVLSFLLFSSSRRKPLKLQAQGRQGYKGHIQAAVPGHTRKLSAPGPPQDRRRAASPLGRSSNNRCLAAAAAAVWRMQTLARQLMSMCVS